MPLFGWSSALSSRVPLGRLLVGISLFEAGNMAATLLILRSAATAVYPKRAGDLQAEPPIRAGHLTLPRLAVLAYDRADENPYRSVSSRTLS